ncbi:MAG: hypothetical protein QNJ40_00315 [Xanthomonadales bacterium]|nr:hypothetical protein [Xanthomonadales bacterium]
MTIQELGSLGEFIASIAVLVTLVYLAIQVRHANVLAKAQTRERMVEQAQQEVYKGFIDNPSVLRSLYKPEPLEEKEWIQLSGWVLAAMRQREYEYFQMKDGNIEKEVWEAYRGLITIHLGSARMRRWWDEWGHVPFNGEFCAMVTELLDAQANPHYFEGLKALIADRVPGPGGAPGSAADSEAHRR